MRLRAGRAVPDWQEVAVVLTEPQSESQPRDERNLRAATRDAGDLGPDPS